MRLEDIHFCFGYVLGKRDKYFKDFILELKSKFTRGGYTRQQIQRILHQSYTPDKCKWGLHSDNGKVRCFRFIKHTIRSHENY